MISADVWARDPDAHGTKRALEERESRKWLDAYHALTELVPEVPNTMLVSIGDREADLFELFALARDPASPRLLVRAHKGRKRTVINDETLTPLMAHVETLDAAGRLELQLPRRGSRRARRADLAVRFAPVCIQAPKRSKEAPLDLWVVHLREEHPPENVEAVEWLLLTNVPTTTYEEALERARWYSARWGI